MREVIYIRNRLPSNFITRESQPLGVFITGVVLGAGESFYEFLRAMNYLTETIHLKIDYLITWDLCLKNCLT